MKLLTTVLLIASLSATIKTSAASHVPVSVTEDRIDIQDRHLSGFSSVDVSGSFDVYITQGNTESVKVEANSDEMDKIITEVKNGVLHIYNKRTVGGISWDWGNKKRLVRVVARNLNAVNLNGSGDVFFKEGLRAASLSIGLRGSGDIKGSVEVTGTLESSLIGSGDITLSGRAENLSVKVAGSGDFDARSLQTVNAAVKLNGSGDVTVNASQRIDAKVAGSGDIRYTGTAKQVSTSKSGSGDISRI